MPTVSIAEHLKSRFRRKKYTSHDSKNCIKSRKHKIKNKYIGDAIMTYPTFPESKKKKNLEIMSSFTLNPFHILINRLHVAGLFYKYSPDKLKTKKLPYIVLKTLVISCGSHTFKESLTGS